MDNLEEIKEDNRLKLLVLHSILFNRPVFEHQTSVSLTHLQHEVLLAVRSDIMSGKRPVAAWYKKQLEREEQSTPISITDLPKMTITTNPQDAFLSELPPVPKPASFSNSEEWTKV